MRKPDRKLLLNEWQRCDHEGSRHRCSQTHAPETLTGTRIMRTSETHPLRIDLVDAGPGRGQIGITFAPGKHDRHAVSGSWARNLAQDLDAIEEWKARAVVTLIEPHEMSQLRIPTLGADIQSRGMMWFHLPIRDVSTPNAEFEAEWPAHSRKLRALLDASENVLVHCRGGLGRAGMISARLLVESGVEPEAAIDRVRAARPGAIETREQEVWVKTGPRIRSM
jgi:protein-tyrosine phosphatase